MADRLLRLFYRRTRLVFDFNRDTEQAVAVIVQNYIPAMSSGGEFGNPLRKFKLVFLGEQSGKLVRWHDDIDRRRSRKLFTLFRR